MRATVIRSNNDFGHAVRRRRRELGWTQDELGARAGYAAKHISRIENGVLEARINTVLALVAALGLDLSLTARSGTEPPDDPRPDESDGARRGTGIEDVF